MQILTINNIYNLYVDIIESNSEFLECTYSFSNTKYPDLNEFIIKSHLKPLNFELNNGSFEGEVYTYSYSGPPIFANDFKRNIDIKSIQLNKIIYGLDNNDLTELQIDVIDFLDTAIHGHLVIRKRNTKM